MANTLEPSDHKSILPGQNLNGHATEQDDEKEGSNSVDISVKNEGFWKKYQKYIICGITAVGIVGFFYLLNKIEQLEQSNLASRITNNENQIAKNQNQITKIEDSVKENAVPSGTIAVWLKSKIPNGWKLCDGSDGTPDLVGKGIYGNSGGKWMPDRKTPYDCSVSFDDQQINTSVNFIQKM